MSAVAVSSEPNFLPFEIEYITPTLDELEKVFMFVDPEYRHAEFRNVEACQNVQRVKRVVKFELVRLPETMGPGHAIAQLLQRDLRPATYEEFLIFANGMNRSLLDRPIVGLGSRAQVGSQLVSPAFDLEGSRLMLRPVFNTDTHRHIGFVSHTEALVAVRR